MPEIFLKAYLNATDAQRKAALDALLGKVPDTRKANADHDFVMSSTEAAKVLSCSKKTLCRYAKQGIIRAVRLGAQGRRANYFAKCANALLASAIRWTFSRFV